MSPAKKGAAGAAGATRTTVAEWLAQLPPERRDECARVVDMVRRNIGAGFEEVVSKGMVVWQVPLARYPDTYNRQPLWYAALAPQKQYLSLHLMPVYAEGPLAAKLRDGFAASGKKLDMGKACIRFRRADDLALDTIGEIVAALDVDAWVEVARSAWKLRG